MLRKVLLMAVAMMILVMAFASVASADTVSGHGWIKAQGAGTALLKMNGEVDIEGHGLGAIYIRDAEVVRADGNGTRTDLPNGDVILRGYRGHVHIVGKQMGVRMVGGKIDFEAWGVGRVLLRGRGSYETQNGFGTWQAGGVELAIQE